MTSLPTCSAQTARRILMHAQGLLDDPDRAIAAASLHKLIHRMGYVQVDTINIVERAHHLTLFSRATHYQKRHLAQLHEKKKSLFEHWTHDASLIPIDFFPQWHHRRKRFIERKHDRLQKWMKHRLGEEPERIIDEVLARIRKEGPLQSRDFEHESGSSSPWWGWKPAKAALEILWWRGDLAVIARRNFQKVYELTERAYPDHHALPPPGEDEFVSWACAEAMERQVIATAREILDFFGTVSPAEVRAWCDEARARGEITEILLEGTDGSKPRKMFAAADWESRAKRAERAFAKLDDRLRLLSPFDPVIRIRDRAERLFNFDYRFEAFVPEGKRKYGYWVMPILRGDRLIGRADLKLHRDRGELEAKGVWWEGGIKDTRALRAKFDEALSALAQFVGADKVRTPRRRRI